MHTAARYNAVFFIDYLMHCDSFVDYSVTLAV